MAVKTVQALLNGQTYNLTLNTATGKYEATITAPATSSYSQAGKYYGVTVKAVDEAGNLTTKDATDATLGAVLKLVVKEKVAPTIIITAPTAGAVLINNKPTFVWTVTDNDSGVNPDSIKLTVDSGTAITGTAIAKTVISGGYSCSYTPTTALTDGSHTIKVDASDNDGNAATQKAATFKIDTVPPVLNITAPTDGLVTNQAACTVVGNTNDAVSSPCTVKIKHNSGAEQAVTVNADGTFSKALTLVEGTNTIVITSTDGAGKTSSVTRTVTLDTKAPVIKSVSLTPNPVDAGKTFVIAIEVTD